METFSTLCFCSQRWDSCFDGHTKLKSENPWPPFWWTHSMSWSQEKQHGIQGLPYFGHRRLPRSSHVLNLAASRALRVITGPRCSGKPVSHDALDQFAQNRSCRPVSLVHIFFFFFLLDSPETTHPVCQVGKKKKTLNKKRRLKTMCHQAGLLLVVS